MGILVIGDSCLDVYTYCKTSRLAPDRPVPVLETVDVVETPGMAYNVFKNLQGLSNACSIVTNDNWKQMKKTRFVDDKSNHMFVRVDTSCPAKPIDINNLVFDYDSIVISDYDKGFLTEEDIEYICANHSQVFLDTKKVLDIWALKAKFIKINNHEYERSKTFINRFANDKVIKTVGGEGCVYRGKIFPVMNKVEVLDVSGAGDTFMAALAFQYTKTEDLESAINFANQCASEVVQHKGVTTVCQK
jgi:D-beta-D-heptose 7-phosphate kinase/D-beta-D-heptose 1-phosphate adenosyltransferase